MSVNLNEIKSRYDYEYRLSGPAPTRREMVAGEYVEALEVELGQVERLRLDLATAEDKLAHATQVVAELRRRIPNPNDLRVLLALGTMHGIDKALVARVRATLEEA